MSQGKRKARHWVGTSGWTYRNWKPGFYPRGLQQGDWLSHYAEHLASVELNASFYRPPARKMLDGWAKKTPPGFLFAIKGWRLITHMKRLKDAGEDAEGFLERLEPLGDKLGPVLFQLPPNFDYDRERLKDFLSALPGKGPHGRWRFAMEFRDKSWQRDEVYRLLSDHNIAWVPFELARQRGPRLATADFVYVRLHGRKAKYRGNYAKRTLQDWAEWLGEQMDEGRDAHVYFDNTDEADHAVRNAMTLDDLLRG